MSNKPPGYFKAPKKSEWTGETGAFFDPKPVPDNRTAKPLVAGYNRQNGEKVLNRIDHPSDIEQAQEMVPTGMVLAVVGFVGFMLCALFWVVFQLMR